MEQYKSKMTRQEIESNLLCVTIESVFKFCYNSNFESLIPTLNNRIFLNFNDNTLSDTEKKFISYFQNFYNIPKFIKIKEWNSDVYVFFDLCLQSINEDSQVLEYLSNISDNNGKKLQITIWLAKDTKLGYAWNLV